MLQVLGLRVLGLRVLGLIVWSAFFVGTGFIMNTALKSRPSKVFRFVFLFALWIPLNFAFNWVNVWGFGYHQMSWTGAIIIALLIAAFLTLVLPQPSKPNTP